MNAGGNASSLWLADEAQTLAAGARIGSALEALAPAELPEGGLHLHLRGELGAGKTTLIRGLLRALGVVGAVRSPTYTLMEPYTAATLELYHFDLYRIAEVEEIELIGAREHFRRGAVCLFEWPERGEGWLPRPALTLHLELAGDGRDLSGVPTTALGEHLLGAAMEMTRSSDPG